MKRGVGTLILLVIFIALVAFVYFFEFKRTEERQAAKRRAELFFSLPQDSVISLALFANHESITLEKRDGLWQIIFPVRTPGDQWAVASHLESIIQARRERIVSDSAALAPFGLVDPRGRIAVGGSDNREEELLIGAENPTGDYLFVKYPNRPQIYTASKALWNHASKSLYELRDKRPLLISATDVHRIEMISVQNGRLVLEKKDAQWFLREPVSIEAENGPVSSLLSRLSNDRIKSFVDEAPRNLEQYGLDRPSTRLHLYGQKGRHLAVLMIGDSSGSNYFARDSSRTGIFTLRQSVVRDIHKSAFDFQDKHLSVFDREKADRIEFRERDEILLTARRDSAIWRFVLSDNLIDDPDRIDPWLTAVENLAADELVTYRPEKLTAYGLGKPQCYLKIYRGSQLIDEIQFGDKVDGQYYVKSGRHPFIYRIKESRIEALKKPLVEIDSTS